MSQWRSWLRLGLCWTLAVCPRAGWAGNCPSCSSAPAPACSSCVPCDPCQSCTSCDPCDCCACDGCDGWGLASILRPSDHCFDDFISPMSNFVYFEDPRTLTEARGIFFHHNLPDQIGTLQIPGGDVQLYAMQLRFALTERLSVIAVKDGYVVADIDGGPLDALLSDGWADVMAGLKYNLVRDPRLGRIVSVGGTYAMPVGSTRTLQGIGDGEMHLFLTGAQRFWGGNAHVISSIGYRTPLDADLQTSAMHWSNHFDVKLTDKIYAFTDVVWWHWTDSANVGLPLGVGGQDVLNLPSTNVTGNDLLT